MKLKIYGETAKQIKKGDIFTATIDSVEGRTVVILVSKEEHTKTKLPKGIFRDEYCPLCYEKLDGKKSHGSWCK